MGIQSVAAQQWFPPQFYFYTLYFSAFHLFFCLTDVWQSVCLCAETRPIEDSGPALLLSVSVHSRLLELYWHDIVFKKQVVKAHI